jgi:hypothetical protein
MALKLLQVDYTFDGPWGTQMALEHTELAHRIADVPGLIWKIWTENSEAREAGGIYLFADESSLDDDWTQKIVRLQAAGIENIRARKFDVNQTLTQLTGGGAIWTEKE